MPKTKTLPSIPPEDLHDFRYIFAPETRPRCGFQKVRGVGWKTEWHGLSDEHILSHFEGPHYYATSRKTIGEDRPYSQTLTIDIDADHKGAFLPRDVRYGRVLEAFDPHEPVVFETPSGGLHAVYILTTFTPRKDIEAWAKAKLLEQGLVVENGSIEILEVATLKRLPLSVGCRTLDPYTLAPIAPSNLDCFFALVETLRDEDRPRLYIPPQKAIQAPRKGLQTPQERGTYKPSPHALGGSELSERDYHRILEGGIEGKGQRHEMTRFLTRHYHEQGLRGDELRDACVGWMDENHNGNSEDWINDREKSIGWFDTCAKNWRGYTPSCPLPDLPPWEVWIKKLKLPRKRDEKVLRFLCERAWLYGEVSESEDWIDVDIPSKSLNAVHKSYKGCVLYLESEGIVQVVREAILPTVKGKGRCRRYRLPLCRWLSKPDNR